MIRKKSKKTYFSLFFERERETKKLKKLKNKINIYTNDIIKNKRLQNYFINTILFNFRTSGMYFFSIF